MTNEQSKYEQLANKLGVDPLILYKAMTEGAWLRVGVWGTCLYDHPCPVFVRPEDLHISFYPFYMECKAKDFNFDEFEGEEEAALCLFDLRFGDINDIAKVCDFGRTWGLKKEDLTK